MRHYLRSAWNFFLTVCVGLIFFAALVTAIGISLSVSTWLFGPGNDWVILVGFVSVGVLLIVGATITDPR